MARLIPNLCHEEVRAVGMPFPMRPGVLGAMASLVLECVTNCYLDGSTMRVDGAMRFDLHLASRSSRSSRG